jgi:monoamine oxidase
MTFNFDCRSRSLWMDIRVAPRASPLTGDRTCDAVIVGAGIAGISTAYELAIKGQKVIVIDRGDIAGGVTARTTAHLAPLCDDLTSEMMKLRGEDISKAFYESQAAAIDASRKFKRRKLSSAISDAWTYCFRLSIPTPRSSTKSSMPCARWAHPCTGSSAFHSNIAQRNMHCATRAGNVSSTQISARTGR